MGKKGGRGAAAGGGAGGSSTGSGGGDVEQQKVHSRARVVSPHEKLGGATPWSAGLGLAFAVVTGLSLYTRLHNVAYPSEVIFDEVHFVSFAQAYASQRPVFDIHPPLGKLVLGLLVHLTGFHTHVPYREIGTPYKHEAYALLRTSQASFGATLAPLAFLSARELGCSPLTCGFVGLTVVLELSLQTASRAIYLDPFLYASIASGFFFALKMWNAVPRDGRRVGAGFWVWGVLCGLAMGCAFSTKHTGLGVVGVVGVVHLIKTFGTVARPGERDRNFEAKFGMGVLLVGLVVGVYLACFVVHFHLKAERYDDSQSMLHNIYRVNMAMLRSNSISVFNHHHGSQWHEWPFHYRGLVYWWKDLPKGLHSCIYLFGNPLIYWSVLVAVAGALYLLDKKVWVVVVEGVEMKTAGKSRLAAVAIGLLGWAANYLPYPLLITRTCFVYHYHPSLYFGMLLLGALLDNFTHPMPTALRWGLHGALLALYVVCYLYYLPFSYGHPISQEYHEEMRKMYFFPVFRQWFPIW